MRVAATTVLCLAAAVAVLVAGARAQPQQPRLFGYAPPTSSSYAGGCAGVRVRVVDAQAQTRTTGGGGWSGGGRAAYVTGTVAVSSSPSPARIAGVQVTLFPTRQNVQPIQAECAGLTRAYTSSGACDFAVAIPRDGGPAALARNWAGASAEVYLESGAVCASPAAYIQGTQTWGDIGAEVGGSIGGNIGGAIFGDLGTGIGGLIGQQVGRDVISGGGGNPQQQREQQQQQQQRGNGGVFGGAAGGLGGLGGLAGGILGRRMMMH